MSSFELGPGCLHDIQSLLSYEEANRGIDAADDLEERLFAAFERLGSVPGLGHRRPDLTSRIFFFYTIDPYMIVHTRNVDPMPILAVFHSSRDIKRLMSSKRFR